MIPFKPRQADTESLERWKGLTLDQRLGVAKEVGDNATLKLARDMGYPDPHIDYIVNWSKDGANPTLVVRFPDSISYEKMVVFARVCGHLLDQDGVISFDEGRQEHVGIRDPSLKGIYADKTPRNPHDPSSG